MFELHHLGIFATGLWLGTFAGILVAGFCQMAHEADDEPRDLPDNNAHDTAVQ